MLTHEPGDTEVGAELRPILLDPATGELSPPHRGAAVRRRQGRARRHASSAPALARGAVVVTDRYVDSTLAYQGAGRDLADARSSGGALGDRRPAPAPHRAARRRAAATGWPGSRSRDRIEAESLAFHERVRESFLELAAADPEHYLVVDAAAAGDEIAAEIRRGSRRCSARPSAASRTTRSMPDERATTSSAEDRRRRLSVAGRPGAVIATLAAGGRRPA